jgi:hypothetical protein
LIKIEEAYGQIKTFLTQCTKALLHALRETWIIRSSRIADAAKILQALAPVQTMSPPPSSFGVDLTQSSRAAFFLVCAARKTVDAVFGD